MMKYCFSMGNIIEANKQREYKFLICTDLKYKSCIQLITHTNVQLPCHQNKWELTLKGDNTILRRSILFTIYFYWLKDALYVL